MAHPALTVDSLQLSDTGLPEGGGDRTGPDLAAPRMLAERKSSPTALDRGSPPAHWNDMHVRRIWAAQVPVEIRGSRRSHGKGRRGQGSSCPGSDLATRGTTARGRGGGRTQRSWPRRRWWWPPSAGRGAGAGTHSRLDRNERERERERDEIGRASCRERVFLVV